MLSWRPKLNCRHGGTAVLFYRAGKTLLGCSDAGRFGATRQPHRARMWPQFLCKWFVHTLSYIHVYLVGCACTLDIGRMECIRMRNFVTNSVIANNVIEDCGIYDFQYQFDGKIGEAIYIGTSSNQVCCCWCCFVPFRFVLFRFLLFFVSFLVLRIVPVIVLVFASFNKGIRGNIETDRTCPPRGECEATRRHSGITPLTFGSMTPSTRSPCDPSFFILFFFFYAVGRWRGHAGH